MEKVLEARLYDHPKYYDVVFGTEWKSEFRFLEQCFHQFVDGKCRRLLEPACGTGRLLYRFAKAGYSVAGIDLNPHAVAYCQRRLRRYGLKSKAVSQAIVGDMADFDLADFGAAQPFDAAFNTINSFRHLPTQRAAREHLQCVANCLRPGGIYVLGLHLTPPSEPVCTEESWSARQGSLEVSTRMTTLEIDRRKRKERVEMVVDVATPTQSFQIHEEMVFRTYSVEQIASLIDSCPSFETADVFDFGYDIEIPLTLDETVEDAVFVLRRI